MQVAARTGLMVNGCKEYFIQGISGISDKVGRYLTQTVGSTLYCKGYHVQGVESIFYRVYWSLVQGVSRKGCKGYIIQGVVAIY